MSELTVWAALTFGVLLASGCATQSIYDNPYSALTPETRARIGSTKVLIGFDSSGQFQGGPAAVSNAGQPFGLLGVVTSVAVSSVIENSRQSHERTMVAIQDAAIDFNFGGQFRAALEPALRQVAWLGATSVTREPVALRQNAAALAAQAREDALLVTDIHFVMSPDLSVYTTTAHVLLLPRNRQLFTPPVIAEDGALFRKKYVFEYPIENPGVDKERAAQLWVEQNGAMVRRALQAGIAHMVRSISADLESPPGLAQNAAADRR